MKTKYSFGLVVTRVSLDRLMPGVRADPMAKEQYGEARACRASSPRLGPTKAQRSPSHETTDKGAYMLQSHVPIRSPSGQDTKGMTIVHFGLDDHMWGSSGEKQKPFMDDSERWRRLN